MIIYSGKHPEPSLVLGYVEVSSSEGGYLSSFCSSGSQLG